MTLPRPDLAHTPVTAKGLFLGLVVVRAAMARDGDVSLPVVVAAAGSAGMSWREFLIADTAGALTSLALVVGLGFGLGEAYEEGGVWVTGAGVLALVVGAVAAGRALAGSSSRGS